MHDTLNQTAVLHWRATKDGKPRPFCGSPGSTTDHPHLVSCSLCQTAALSAGIEGVIVGRIALAAVRAAERTTGPASDALVEFAKELQREQGS